MEKHRCDESPDLAVADSRQPDLVSVPFSVGACFDGLDSQEIIDALLAWFGTEVHSVHDQADGDQTERQRRVPAGLRTKTRADIDKPRAAALLKLLLFF